MMKLGSHKGFRRLALLITAIAFLVTYLILWIVEESGAGGWVGEDEAFIEFPIVSAIVAGIIWGLVKATYWVIDGFKNPDSD